MAIKVVGSKQIASGTRRGYREFGYTVILGMAYTLCVASIACVGAVVPYAEAVGYHWGQSACYYATDAGCAPLYQQIFLGDSETTGLGPSFVVFAFVAAANTIFVLLKAGCYATLDFDFMAIASILALAFVFTPAMLVAIYVYAFRAHTVPARATASVLASHCRACTIVWGARLHCTGMMRASQLSTSPCTRRTLRSCPSSVCASRSTCEGCCAATTGRGQRSTPTPLPPQRCETACRLMARRARLMSRGHRS